MFTDDFIFAVANVYLRLTNWKLVRSYRRLNGRSLDLARPVRFSERMSWRKAVDRNPHFEVCSDKLQSKAFVQRVCPDLPLPATLWVGTEAKDIPDELLRQDVFVKANHGCGFNFHTRGQPCDRAALTKLSSRWLKTKYGAATCEWPYFRVERKIFVEETIRLDGIGELVEFNIRASNGHAIQGSVLLKAKTPEQWHFYLDAEGRPTWGMTDSADSIISASPALADILEPYRQAVTFARRLSQGVDYARYDFFWNGRTLYGGEITVFPASGFDDPLHPHANKILLAGWNLLDAHFFRTPPRGLKGIYAAALRRHLEKSRALLQNKPIV